MEESKKLELWHNEESKARKNLENQRLGEHENLRYLLASFDSSLGTVKQIAEKMEDFRPDATERSEVFDALNQQVLDQQQEKIQLRRARATQVPAGL